jgi:hypothetical protein
MWHRELWLIDHGASLYFHHSWHNWEEQAKRPFVLIKDHVLLPQATMLEEVDQEFTKILSPDLIKAVVDLIPGGWLGEDGMFATAEDHRSAYATFLNTRIANSEIFVNEANHARTTLI